MTGKDEVTQKRKAHVKSSIPQLLSELVDTMLETGEPFVIDTVVEKFIAELDAKAPGVVNGYVVDNRTRFVASDFAAIMRSRRARARAGQKGRRFGEAAAQAEAGDTSDLEEFLSPFDAPYCVDDHNEWLPAGKMRGEHHTFVAGRYQQSGRGDLLLAQFHRAVARKVGKRRTEEVFTPEQYVALMESITQKTA